MKKGDRWLGLTPVKGVRNTFLVTAFFVVFFYVFAHGHRFTNTMYSGDSLYMLYQNDSAWQIALGRFMNPIWVMVRGGMVSPFLLTMLSLLFFILAAYFTVDFLELDKVLSMAAVCGVMTCNTAVLATNSTFLHNSDFYAGALFLAVLSVWLMKAGKPLQIMCGGVLLAVSIGTYQAYVGVAAGLVMLYFLVEMQKKDRFLPLLKEVGRYFAGFLLGAVLYYGGWKLFQKIFNIWTANTYNGMAALGEFSFADMGELLCITYEKVFAYFWNPEVFATMPFRGTSLSVLWVYLLRFCNVTAGIFLIVWLLYNMLNKKGALWQKLLQLLSFVLFPFGINMVCFFSQGMEHTLMTYAFCLVYIFVIKAGEQLLAVKVEKKIKVWSWYTVLALLGCTVWCNIVYSNQVYVKKDLQDKAALSLLTRIVYEVESMENYRPGVTPVAFYGSFENSQSIASPREFSEIAPYGMGSTALTYADTEYSYLKYVMNVNMNLVRSFDAADEAAQMPCYPEDGSVAYVGDTIIVKISEVQ